LPENIDRFRRELDRQIALHRDDDAPNGLMIDAEANLGELSLATAEALQLLAPFGNGNPMPQFLSRQLTVQNDRRLGAEGAHRKLTVASADGARQSVIWFHGGDVELPAGPIDLVYTLGINDYRGERTLQLAFVAVRAAEVAEDTSGRTHPALLPIHDLRNRTIRRDELPATDDDIWYAAGSQLGERRDGVTYAPRPQIDEVAQGRPLVLWSIPPSPELLHWLLETAAPTAIYVWGQSTTDDSAANVLRQVGGMCKYALAHDSLLNLDRMAARLGQTEAIIRYSLLWLAARNLITLVEWTPADTAPDAIRIAPGSNTFGSNTFGSDPPGSDTPANSDQGSSEADLIFADLEAALAEVRAYRRYFLRARLSDLGLTAAN
jgi:single-stranded-DNA-specific exonuclease